MAGFVWPFINQTVTALFDLLLLPVAGFSVVAQIIPVSVLMAVLALYVYKYASNQAGIQQAKDKIKAYLLELRIYRDDPVVLLRAEGQILRHTARYLTLATVPVAVMIIPFVLILAQVEARFAFEAFDVGDQVTVTVFVDQGEMLQSGPVSIQLPKEIVAETPAHRIVSQGEIRWRLRVKESGIHPMLFKIGAESAERSLIVAANVALVAPYVYRNTDVRSLMYPGESGKSTGAVKAIRLDYPRAHAVFLGLSSVSWSVVGLSVLLGFLLRGLFKVTF